MFLCTAVLRQMPNAVSLLRKTEVPGFSPLLLLMMITATPLRFPSQSFLNLKRRCISPIQINISVLKVHCIWFEEYGKINKRSTC